MHNHVQNTFLRSSSLGVPYHRMTRVSYYCYYYYYYYHFHKQYYYYFLCETQVMPETERTPR